MRLFDGERNDYSGRSFPGVDVMLRQEFRALGFRAYPLGPLSCVSRAGRTGFLSGSDTGFTSATASKVLKRKDLARAVFIDAGLSVAKGRTFLASQREEARSLMRELGSIVIKPVDGRRREGVTVNVSEETFDAAWDLACSGASSGVLVEQLFERGGEARYLVVGGRCVAVYGFQLPFVTGDGVRTIRDLVDAKNRDRMAKNPVVHGAGDYAIEIDRRREDLLSRQSLSSGTVLEPGRVLFLDNRGPGRETVDITDHAHPSLKRVVERVGAAVPGLDVFGVDLFALDHCTECGPDDYILVEANTNPALEQHLFPDFGHPVNVCRLIAENCARQMETQSVVPGLVRGDVAPGAGSDRRPAATGAARPRAMTLVFAGDVFARGNGREAPAADGDPEPQTAGADRALAALQPLISGTSLLVTDLGAVLAEPSPNPPPSPPHGPKHREPANDPGRIVERLEALGVGAVGLANPRVMDLGPAGLAEAILRLRRAGIHAFGAGADMRSAFQPLSMSAFGEKVHVLTASEHRREPGSGQTSLGAARDPGIAQILPRMANSLRDMIAHIRRHDPRSFIIVLPHWSGDPLAPGATEAMFTLTASFHKAGADLVLGHGPHALPQCWVDDTETTVFSLGSAKPGSDEASSGSDALPFGLVARLVLQSDNGRWAAGLRLYPVVAEDLASGARPRPADETEAAAIYERLAARGQRDFRADFALRADERGYYVARTAALSRWSCSLT